MLVGSIIKHFNIFKASRLHFIMGCVAYPVIAFILKAVKPALRRRIDAPMSRNRCCRCQICQNQWIEFPYNISLQTALNFFIRHTSTISFATHRADHTQFLEIVLKCMTSILATAIRVVPSTPYISVSA